MCATTFYTEVEWITWRLDKFFFVFFYLMEIILQIKFIEKVFENLNFNENSYCFRSPQPSNENSGGILCWIIIVSVVLNEIIIVAHWKVCYFGEKLKRFVLLLCSREIKGSWRVSFSQETEIAVCFSIQRFIKTAKDSRVLYSLPQMVSDHLDRWFFFPKSQLSQKLLNFCYNYFLFL